MIEFTPPTEPSCVCHNSAQEGRQAGRQARAPAHTHACRSETRKRDGRREGERDSHISWQPQNCFHLCPPEHTTNKQFTAMEMALKVLHWDPVTNGRPPPPPLTMKDLKKTNRNKNNKNKKTRVRKENYHRLARAAPLSFISE